MRHIRERNTAYVSLVFDSIFQEFGSTTIDAYIALNLTQRNLAASPLFSSEVQIWDHRSILPNLNVVLKQILILNAKLQPCAI